MNGSRLAWLKANAKKIGHPRAAFDVIAPTETGLPAFAILPGADQAGAMGKAMILGATPVRLNVADAGHALQVKVGGAGNVPDRGEPGQQRERGIRVAQDGAQEFQRGHRRWPQHVDAARRRLFQFLQLSFNCIELGLQL
jgi:hypothetical protein